MTALRWHDNKQSPPAGPRLSTQTGGRGKRSREVGSPTQRLNGDETLQGRHSLEYWKAMEINAR